MAFESMYLEEDIHIDRIYTIHYFEYKSDFHFAGERHNFWEFQCVDKGKAEIETDNGIYHLTSGQLIFHKPNEFHNLIAIGNTAPNIVVVSFECDSPCMKFFEKKLLKLSDSERNLMGMLIAEARRCIKTPLDDPYTEKMEKDSLCSHRCPSGKGKLQRGGSNSRYRTRCCNRTVQGSGYDVDTEIFSGGKIHGLF